MKTQPERTGLDAEAVKLAEQILVSREFPSRELLAKQLRLLNLLEQEARDGSTPKALSKRPEG